MGSILLSLLLLQQRSLTSPWMVRACFTLDTCTKYKAFQYLRVHILMVCHERST